MNLQKTLLVTVFAFIALAATAQTNLDTILLSNGDEIVGEIKQMEKAIIQIETDYSDSDFMIDWDNVSALRSSSFFLINLQNGTIVNGNVNTDPADSTKVIIISDEGNTFETSVRDIVYLKSVKTTFVSRLNASIGIGLTLTKANNLRQFNTRSSLGYTANTWSINGTYNALFSVQDSVADVRRTDGGISSQIFLPKDWFAYISANFLSNTEQKLKLRTTPTVGIGNYVVRDNRLYLALIGGLAWNIERFETDDDDRSSLEGLIAMDANLFNTGDLSLFTTVYYYPSITESGRHRTDIGFDVKYDFPYDIYIKFGFTFNWDNMPAAGASETDYTTTLTVGWDL